MRRLTESSLSLPILVFTVLAAFHLAFSLSLNPPGYLTWDSGTYHYMAKTFAETGSFIVWNGYEEFPSPALEVAQLKVHDDHLVAQYPEMLSVVVYPLYLLFGYHGLLLLEALSFLAINGLLFALATHLLGGRRHGWLAMAIYSFATYSWEYSQSSYPHLVSTAFLLAAYYLVARTLPLAEGIEEEVAAARRPLWCAAAGMAAGLAVALRLDAAFGVPGLFAAFLLLRPVRWRDGLALGLGFLPGMLFLSWANWLKFDFFFPFYYGDRGRAYYTGDATWYLPILALGALTVAAVVFWLRAPSHWRKRSLVGLGGIVGLAALAMPTMAWDFLRQLADGTYQLVVDLRIRRMDLYEQGLERSPAGAMVYMGGVKKSLLQSCPYLVLLLSPLFDALRRGDLRRRRLARLAFLWAVPAAFIGFYSYLAWHGSVALNMRYFNPALPFLAVLTAWWLDDFRQYLKPWVAGVFGVALALALFFRFTALPFTLFEQELWFLTAPLGIVLVLLFFELLRRSRLLPSLGGPLVAYGLVAAMAWSAAVTFGRDYPTSARARSTNLQVAGALVPFLHDDVLLVTDYPDICWDLLDRFDRLRIAYPIEDEWESFEGLAKHHLAAGRDVLMATSSHGAEKALRTGVLAPFEVAMIHSWQSGGRPTLVLLALRETDGDVGAPAPLPATPEPATGTPAESTPAESTSVEPPV